MKKIKNRKTGFTRAPFLSGIKNGAGFTLLELIMAIFVLAVVTTTSFTLIQQSIASASQARSKLIAAYLGQEGIEIVKNIRSTNWLTPGNTRNDWDDKIGTAVPNYRIDYQSPEFPDTTCSGSDYLKYDGNFYNCSSGPDSKFKRKITISKISDDQLKVISKVEWEERGTTKSVEVIEYLFNWYYGS